MSEEILVEKIIEKEGSTDGRAWTRYGVKDGNGEWYSTFEQSIVAGLKEGHKARIEYTSKPVNGRVVKNLVSAEPVNGSVPETYSHQKPDGEADWDKVAIGKTRCALWAAFLGSQLSASVYVKASSAEGIDAQDAVIRAGRRLVVAAEQDVFERAPGDDGIPF